MDNNDMIIEPEKKNKNLIIAIAIIAVIALGLGGYVVYNKMSNKPEEPKQSERPNTNDNTANEDDGNFECVLEDLTGEILKYPTKNDDSVTMKVEKNTETVDEDEMMREYVTLKYKDFTITYTNDKDSDSLDTLEVKDSTGKVIYSTKTIKTAVSGQVCKNNEYNYGKHVDTVPTISGGKLYFINLSDSF